MNVIRRGAAERVTIGGTSIPAAYKGALGGMIYNPRTSQEQGIFSISAVVGRVTQKRFGPFNTLRVDQSRFPLNHSASRRYDSSQTIFGPPEPLFIDLTGPAALKQTATTSILYPGRYFTIPPGVETIWVNAASSGHRFASIVITPPVDYPPTPYNGAFPPIGPVTALATIPSYLYKQYEDDDDLQGFVQAYNDFTQAFVDWFNNLNLPIYQNHSGALLDWVATGLYGLKRPTLFSGRSNAKGPLNTWRLDTMRLNQRKRVSVFTDVAATSDDVYKRILTWHFFKGDGKALTVPWMKRRVGRFLFCDNGRNYPFPVSQISVIGSAQNQLTITIVSGFRRWTAGSRFNRLRFNRSVSARPNAVITTTESFQVPAMAPTFVEAIQSGALETPYQYNVTARVSYLGVA